MLLATTNYFSISCAIIPVNKPTVSIPHLLFFNFFFQLFPLFLDTASYPVTTSPPRLTGLHFLKQYLQTSIHLSYPEAPQHQSLPLLHLSFSKIISNIIFTILPLLFENVLVVERKANNNNKYNTSIAFVFDLRILPAEYVAEYCLLFSLLFSSSL